MCHFICDADQWKINWQNKNILIAEKSINTKECGNGKKFEIGSEVSKASN